MESTDLLALANNLKSNDGLMGGNGSSWLFWILIIFFLFTGGWGGNSATQNSITRAEMQDGFNNQNIVNTLSGISNQINTGFDNVALGFANQTQQMNNGFNSVNQSICNLGYQMAQNCCDIKTTIHNESESVKALITANTIQDLRDKVQAKDLELAQSNILSINQNQTVALEQYMRNLCGCGCSCNC